MAQGHLVATHQRSWERAQTFYEPIHYLALVERKPGDFDAAKPLQDWQLPACFWSLRRRLEVDMGPSGTREFIKVMRLLELHSLRDLSVAVERGQGRVRRHFVQPRRARIGKLAALNSRVRVASSTSNNAATLASDNPLA